MESLVEMGTEVSRRDVFVPEVSLVKLDRYSDERIFRGAPDLAIEVVSPSDTTKRLKAKVDTYLRGGSSTVSVVFPDSRSVTIYSGSNRELQGDQTVEDPVIPGFSTPVSAFFE
jgi:Uma2 family endonuclease